MSYSPTLGRWMETDPVPYVDGPNLYQMELSDPVELLDPSGTQAQPSTQPSTQPSAPTFKGFEDPRYQQHDALINELVADFNAHKGNYCGCNDNQSKKVTDLDPAVVKAWLIQETGGNDQDSRAAWAKDPAQVNVPGQDWNQYKADLGLKEPKQRNEGDLRTNLIAALKYLCRKGFGGSGQPARNRLTGFFDGWPKALERYGPPNRKDFYGPQILKRASNPPDYVPIQAG